MIRSQVPQQIKPIGPGAGGSPLTRIMLGPHRVLPGRLSVNNYYNS